MIQPGIIQNKFRESSVSKPRSSSDARLHRLCFGNTFRPVQRTYSTKIPCSGVPEQQPFASSHIKPIYYNRFSLKLQVFFGI